MKIIKFLTNIWNKLRNINSDICEMEDNFLNMKYALFADDEVSKYHVQQYLDIFNNHFIISKTDTQGIITYVNKEFLRMHGLKESQIMGKTHKVVNAGFTPYEVYTDLWNTICKGEVWSNTLCYKDANRKLRFAYVNIFPILNETGDIVEYLALRQDITELIEMEKEIQETQKQLIVSLGSVIECKNGELYGHVERVSNYSYILAKSMGLSEKEANIIKMASPMHDAGKIGIPDELLNAPRRLNKNEFEVVKEHSNIGYNIFKDSNLTILKSAALIAHHHHEKWDGTGYPQGLKGTDISIEGRVTAVADVYDALSTERAYKEAWSVDKIDKYFKAESGKSFDPEVIECYFRNKQYFGPDDFE